MERNVYGRYSSLGIVFFSLTMLVLFGIPAIVMVTVHLSAQPFFAGGVVNGLGHAIGYRSFEMPSTATNLVPWGVLLGGEELHNNHHAFPRSARFSVQPWEFDIGWFFVRVFRQLGLAKVRYEAPRPRFERQRSELDADTVQALFKNRMHVLREYARRVVLPVCRELARREPRGTVPTVTAKLLIRHPTLLADEAHRVLGDLLKRHEVLRRVVEYREGLATSVERDFRESGEGGCAVAGVVRAGGGERYTGAERVFARLAGLRVSALTDLIAHRTGRMVERVTVRMAKLD